MINNKAGKRKRKQRKKKAKRQLKTYTVAKAVNETNYTRRKLVLTLFMREPLDISKTARGLEQRTGYYRWKDNLLEQLI